MAFRNSKSLPFLLIAMMLVFGCSGGIVEKPGKTATAEEPQETPSPEDKGQIPSLSEVDVVALANKPMKRFEKVFGTAVRVTKIKDNPVLMPGEYREYRVKGHPKGLSVRFYRNQAKRFNLLLGKPEKSATNALKKIFKINTAKLKRVKSDPLSKTWQGNYGSIIFKTAYAKRDKPAGKFVMLHAEIAK